MVYRSFNPYGNPIQGGFNPYGMQQMMRPMPFPPPGPGNFNGPAQAFARGAGNFIGAPGFGAPPAQTIRSWSAARCRAIRVPSPGPEVI